MGHEDAGGGHHAHQIQGIHRRLGLERSSLHGHQGVDRHTLGMGLQGGQHLQQRGPIPDALAHADDAAAAEIDAGPAHPGQGFQALLVAAGADDLPVVLRAGVEVVVVGGKTRFRQATGLAVAEHPRRYTGLQPQLPHAPHHLQHRLEGGPVADVAPGPAHAEAMGTRSPGGPGPLQHRLHLQLRPAGHVAAVVHRLGAVGAVLLAASRLHRQQRGQLHPIARVGLAVHGLGLPEQIHQGQLQQRLDLVPAPVMAERRLASGAGVRRWSGCGCGGLGGRGLGGGEGQGRSE